MNASQALGHKRAILVVFTLALLALVSSMVMQAVADGPGTPQVSLPSKNALPDAQVGAIPGSSEAMRPDLPSKNSIVVTAVVDCNGTTTSSVPDPFSKNGDAQSPAH